MITEFSFHIHISFRIHTWQQYVHKHYSCISRHQKFYLKIVSQKFDLYMSIYGNTCAAVLGANPDYRSLNNNDFTTFMASQSLNFVPCLKRIMYFEGINISKIFVWLFSNEKLSNIVCYLQLFFGIFYQRN